MLVDSPGVTAKTDLAARANLLEHCRHNTHCGVVYVLDPAARSSEEASQVCIILIELNNYLFNKSSC